MPGEGLQFVVGDEKALTELLSRSDVILLLEGACRAGAFTASLLDDKGHTLWEASSSAMVAVTSACGDWCGEAPLLLEGEPVGLLRITGTKQDAARLEALLQMIESTLTRIVFGNLKRMLTTEIHTQALNLSYEDLLEVNRQLTDSEQRYRELSESLEQLVQQRTGELKQAYARLLQQEKMASIGQLASGVAHEINNPLGYILSNVTSLQRYYSRFVEMLEFYRQGLAAGDRGLPLCESSKKKWDELRLNQIIEDLDDLFAETIGGAQRVMKIVSDLKGFSHVDALGAEELDLPQEVDRALSVLRHDIPGDARIERSYSGALKFAGRGGELSQLLLNLLKNALQSRSSGLVIAVEGGSDEDGLWFGVSDNGPGIAEELRQKVFEPFFTTREVGQGVGLGLTIAHDLVNRWGGGIAIERSALGGTRVSVRLPAGKEGGDGPVC